MGVAIYQSGGLPTHAARQLSDGNWTSKLGPNIDITHSLSGLEGPEVRTGGGLYEKTAGASRLAFQPLHWLGKPDEAE